MKAFSKSEHGQALVLIALAAIILFGFVALAVDGSAKFSDRRHAQNAADTAALAGALALVEGDNSGWQTKALDKANQNGYLGDLVNNQIWVFKCNASTASRNAAPMGCGPYEGKANYVSVIILSHVNTTFARVIGFSQMHNLVQAVTHWSKRGPLYDGNLIVALNPNPCTGSGANGNIALGTSGGGNVAITLNGGGAFVNSGGTGCGMEQMGCPTISVNGGELDSVGDGNINLSTNSAQCQNNLTLPSSYNYNEDQYPFPPEDVPPMPSACNQSYVAPTNTTTLNPGYYSQFPPNKDASNHNMSNNITLNAGIYCLDTDLSLGNNQSITGSNVLIYLKPGRKISMQNGTLTLTGRTSADTTYQGYVVIVGTNFTGQPLSCVVNGGASVNLTGTVYAPYCNIAIDGGSNTMTESSQFIGYTVKLTGNADINLNYVAANNAKSQPKVGLMR